MHYTSRFRSRHRTVRPRWAAISLVVAVALAAGACGSDGGSSSAAGNSTTTADDAPITTTSTLTPLPDEVRDEVQAILDASLEPGAIAWDCCGADAPATAAIVGVRAPGREDLVAATGEDLTGAPVSIDVPFNVGSLTTSLVQTLGWQLVDEGVLDPDATVEASVPQLADAEQVTVEMLLTDRHGWGDFGAVDDTSITADYDRAWTLDEVLDSVAEVPRVSEPGEYNGQSVEIAMVALAKVIEDATGQPLAEVFAENVGAPLALDDTFVSDGADLPADFLAGVFVLGGERQETSAFPNTSFNTYLSATSSVVSTVPDLLDLLDGWTQGTLFTTDRRPTADRFPSDRPTNDGTDLRGLGVPLNAYCPCTPEGEGNSASFVGRTPKGLGSDSHVLAYPDGISVVLHYNSNEEVSDLDLRAVAQEIHDTVAAAA